jgi:hypothetical protein
MRGIWHPRREGKINRFASLALGQRAVMKYELLRSSLGARQRPIRSRGANNGGEHSESVTWRRVRPISMPGSCAVIEGVRKSLYRSKDAGWEGGSQKGKGRRGRRGVGRNALIAKVERLRPDRSRNP